ncbi:hypothetical protein Nepgr_010474 [Nepenthes gracilis]|uniref:Hs1pro-1 C-terminal domain-containing protein n=1 Tax=Nepenthes gracilis TaxID=150966 RepID=A0AAD3SD12_NEPGR|nr:hypothetical protein Nepgr_010474 [Nepenthes gracilis]
MTCFGRYGERESISKMACFQRASPGLKCILFKLYRAENPMELDHHLYEFGSVEYHIKSSASDPHNAYLSISTPLLSQGTLIADGVPHYTIQMVKDVCPDVVEIISPAKEGYQLTLQLNLARIPQGKEATMKRFFYADKQLLVMAMWSLDANENKLVMSLDSYDMLSQIFLEPSYYPNLDCAEMFLGHFAEH